VAELEADLARSRPEWDARQRALVARLAQGAVGRARSFDLTTYVAARADALTLLRSVIADDHSALFQTTERFRAGADGRDKTDQLLAATYSLLEDLLFLQHGASGRVRNTDIMGELKKLAAATSFAWLERAAAGLGEVRRGMRRNLLRSLSLDAFATALE
jgi:DNA polymerase-3 subunit delta'